MSLGPFLPPQALVGRAYPSKEDVATLVVAGTLFAGWQQVEVTRSLEQAAGTFGFAATARWPEEPNPIRVRPGQEAQVWLGTDLVVSGHIDEVAPSYDAGAHTIQVQGRSKTADLVDCSAVDAGPQFHRLTVYQIALRLATVYGVEVVTDAPPGEPVGRFVLEPGETVHAAVERLARLRGLLVTDDAQGRLVLTQAGTARASGLLRSGAPPDANPLDRAILRPGGNLLAASARFVASERYSEYRCRGQSIGSDTVQGRAAAGAAGAETDDGLDRRRVLIVSAEGPADAATCKARATWEAAVRAGKSMHYECTVQGWRQTLDGELWTPNLLVRVQDPVLGIDDELLLVECRYTLDESGTKCAMVLAPRAGYLPEPPRKARPGAGLAVGAWKELRSGAVPVGTGPGRRP